MVQMGGVVQTSIRFSSIGLVLLIAAGCASAPKQTDGVEYYIQGIQAERAGNPDRATGLFEQAVAVNPNLRMAHIRLGDAYRAKGDYARAATHYQAATELDPYALYNHYNLGLAYQLLNRFQEAAKAYLAALELNPADVKSNMNLGVVYLALGETGSAVAFLERATKLDPTYSAAWSNLGVALDASGDLTKAEATYRKALELDSNNPATLQNLAQNLISQKKAPEAITIMEQVLPRDSSPGVRRRYAEALALDKKYDAALAQLDLALKVDPNNVPSLNTKADILIQRYVESLELENRARLSALEAWKTSLRIQPNQPKIAEQVRKWENPNALSR